MLGHFCVMSIHLNIRLLLGSVESLVHLVVSHAAHCWTHAMMPFSCVLSFLQVDSGQPPWHLLKIYLLLAGGCILFEFILVGTYVLFKFSLVLLLMLDPASAPLPSPVVMFIAVRNSYCLTKSIPQSPFMVTHFMLYNTCY